MSEDAVAGMMIEARRWYDTERPEVSIVILNFNHAELTQICLFHVWMHTRGLRYEIILVDNGSSDSEFAALAATTGPFTLIRLGANRYFGEGNNIGAERSKGRLIVFLNNDAFVSQGWLAPLLHCHDHAWNAGAVGPKLVYPGGRLQELGSFIDETGQAVQVGKSGCIAPDAAHPPRIVDYSSAACLLLSRELFLKVGGFDFRYEPAYYEDADLCFKIAALGKYIYCCPESSVVHIERATTSANTNLVGRNVLANNRQIFLERWGTALKARAAGDGLVPRWPLLDVARLPAKTEPAARHGARIAFYIADDLVPGETVRTLLSAAASVARKFDTFVITPEPYSRLRLGALSRELSLDLAHVGLRNMAHVADIGPIDLCVIASDRGRSAPPCPGLRNILICNSAEPLRGGAPESDDTERYRIDERLTFSHFCHHHWQTKPHETIPMIISPPAVNTPARAKTSKAVDVVKILTIGRFWSGEHNKRQDIAIEALRRITKFGRRVELHIVGWLLPDPAHQRHFASLTRAAEGLPIHFHPNASGATIEQLLQDSMLYWQMTGFGIDPGTAPHRCETFGISIVDAMAASCIAIVVDSGGPLDFVFDGKTGFTYRTIEDLVEQSTRVMDDPALRLSIAAEARAATHLFTQARFDDRWEAIVERHLACLETSAGKAMTKHRDRRQADIAGLKMAPAFG